MAGSQTKTGKAFEYSLLVEFYEKLKDVTNVSINKNSSYIQAKSYFEEFSQSDQDTYRITSSSSVNFILDLEPRLKFGINKDDILELELLADAEGQSGDVRDLIIIRSIQNWEIGISAKNNHKAVKHSRLSTKLDFGDKWVGKKCSKNYFKEIAPIFEMLTDIRTKNKNETWDILDSKEDQVYYPILKAFRKELLSLEKKYSNVVAENLIQYLIGCKDFYKVIKEKGKVEIQAYNIHGTLNKSFKKIKPKAKISKLKLPTKLIDISFKEESKTTLILSLNEGWQISFRIHNASSKVEASLKFDIQLISAPESRFTNHKFIYSE